MKKKSPPTRTLRERPDLNQLKRQAKELLAAFAAGDPTAAAEVSMQLRAADPATFALHDAQFVLARSYGFDSWPKLKAYVDGVTVGRLAEAVRAGDLRRVRAMLKARPELVNYDQAENDEHRAIHFAVMARNAEMTRLLMRLGADARSGIYPHRKATTALTIARERGYAEIAEIIEEEERRRPTQPRARFEEERQTDVESAIERGDAEWLRARHAAGELAPGVLTLAVKLDRPDVLAILLDLGLDPNEPTRLENLEEVVRSAGSPLWHCAAAGKEQMARMLLERGANPNLQVYASGSSVFAAYHGGHRELVPLMRQYGGIVDPITAGIFGEEEVARELLAAEARGEKLPAGMLEAGSVVEDLLRGAVEGGQPEIARMALSGVDWGPDDERWGWILWQAMTGGNFECVRMVAARSPGYLRIRHKWRTILHDVAGWRGANAGEMTAILVDAGARMDLRDTVLHSTPLGWACRWGKTDMVRVLLERGADPVEADAEEWARPRAWAGKMGNEEALTLLKDAIR